MRFEFSFVIFIEYSITRSKWASEPLKFLSLGLRITSFYTNISKIICWHSKHFHTIVIYAKSKKVLKAKKPLSKNTFKSSWEHRNPEYTICT